MGDVFALGPGRNPTLLRAGAPWGPLRSAKRCLFGTPDPVELKMHLEKETQRLQERDKVKWNFNFATGEPLDCGQYAWKKVRRDGDDQPSSDRSGSSTESSSCEDIVMVQTHITDYMRKRKLSSSNQAEATMKDESKAKRRFST